MTSKDKNKSGLKTKSKILVFGLVLVILFGTLSLILSPAKIAEASFFCEGYGNPAAICGPRLDGDGDGIIFLYCFSPVNEAGAEAACTKVERLYRGFDNELTKEEADELRKEQAEVIQAQNASKTSPLERAVADSCGVIWRGSIAGCLVAVFYYLFYGLAGLLLAFAAMFFDIIIALTLSSSVYGKFISEVWTIVRDLSNIFFILILLYAAIQIILGIGQGAKKIIANVIIMALLINFSMFFTKVIIDSSNILALVFYNKLSVTTEKEGKTLDRSHIPALNKEKAVEDKALSAALVSHFDPSTLLDDDFFKKIETDGVRFSKTSFLAYVGTGALFGNFIPIPGVGAGLGALAGSIGYFLKGGGQEIPIPLLLGIITITGGIMIFAAYSFFIAGLSFVSRIIELWILIIFSPFAFMSFSVPLLSKIEYIGWDNWLRRLLKVAFLAPIFMFLLYLIFKIIEADPIRGLADRMDPDKHWIEVVLFLVIPALIILILLNKATKFAKDTSGPIGEAMIKGAKIAAGVGLGVTAGVAIGGVAKGMQAGGGYIGEGILSNTKLAEYKSAKKEDQTGRFKGMKAGLKRFTGKKLRTLAGGELADGAGGLVGSNFDLRQGAFSGLLKSAEGVTGLNLGSKSKFLLKDPGGYRGDQERAQKRRDARNASLKVARDEPLQQELNEEEEKSNLQKNEVSHELDQIENRRKVARENLPEFEQAERAARGERDVAKDNLNSITKNSTGTEKTTQTNYDTKKADLEKIAKGTAETEYDKREAEFEAIIASGIANTDPIYTATETAYMVAKAAASPAYVAAKNDFDNARTTVGATYATAKDAFDEANRKYKKVNDELRKRAENAGGLTNHRSAVKGKRATMKEDGTTIDMEANETEFNTAKTELAEAKALLDALKIKNAGAEASLDKAKASLKAAIGSADEALAQSAYDTVKSSYDAIKDDLENAEKDEEKKKRRKELATAAWASARFGDGKSINDFEDKILPELEEKIENENRRRQIADAENIREMSALWTLFTTAGDNTRSRNAIAHEIIEKVSKKRV